MDELKDIIALLKRTDFDPAEIDTDLHKRVADAIQDGYIKRFDMRVNSRDGDQDNSDNTSCQGAEHAHIELIKSVAHLTNNKDVFLCILQFHTRVGFRRSRR